LSHNTIKQEICQYVIINNVILSVQYQNRWQRRIIDYGKIKVIKFYDITKAQAPRVLLTAITMSTNDGKTI